MDDTDTLIDQIIDETRLSAGLLLFAARLPDKPGSAIVCTSEMTPEQISLARRKNRLLVRRDGIGFALVHQWKRRKPSNT